ncbi:MAG: FAD-dependent oxidoreductase [Pseudomonadales bacterium]|nr:FAD-dependent oxidoreductase [Pseudomonadales bacterium]NIX07830.1 FAD-dependent oxidoreductase [Pseudomonadales bacterium]
MTHALIAGAGIGGLSAALSLARRGLTVSVFEQAGGLGEVGAGIQLSPNASRVLHHLGLEKALEPVGFLPQAVEMRDWRSGRLLVSSPIDDAFREKFVYPYYHVHRADLLRVLERAVRAQPGIELLTSSRVERIEPGDAGVHVEAGGARHRGDLLVGADGIHSTVRESLFGAEAPTFTGNVAWRGLVPTSAVPQDLVRPAASVWWGPRKHFVHYYVRGGELINCVCVVEKDGWEVESWSERGDLGELRADFAGWHETVRLLIDNLDPNACFKWALFDRPPMPVWGLGPVTLLGDACHPTLPFMAQGAAMAIEDGAVLARCLAECDVVAQGLRRYEGLRRARTARVQAGSRRNARIFHLSGLPALFRNLAVGRASGRVMDWLYGYDALDPDPS